MTSAPRFDEVVHSPNRLQLCALLAPVKDVEFAVLRDTLHVSDSVLSKQLRILQEAGYIRILKSTSESKTRTRAAITARGRRAYRSHIAELQRLVSSDKDALITTQG